jgi:hypothetical protein
MLNETTLEQRLVILEQIVSDLKQKIDNQSTSENWLQKLVGSISDESALLESLEYGRTFRLSDKPVDENDKSS